jgi:hypothetical protein
MKSERIIPFLAWLVVPLASVAAGLGVLSQGSGQHYDFVSLRGETVQIWGSGLYRYDSVSGASQEIAQDVVTLCIGIPLLIVATMLFSRGSLRGKVLLAGTLGYFLYTYTSMATLTAYNELFLVYVALMSLSLFAFILTVLSIDVAALPAQFSSRLPRRTIGAFLIFLGVMLALMWLGRIILPSLVSGSVPFGLDNYSTLVIQTLDLGIIVPAAVLAGVLLFRRSALGYLLSSVVLVKGFTMGAATSAMVIGQVLAGVQVEPVVAAFFFGITLVDIALVALMLWSLSEVQGSKDRAPGYKLTQDDLEPGPIRS